METFVNESKETFKLVQCSNCKKEKEQNEFRFYKGSYTKNCNVCLNHGNKNKCEHNRRKDRCKDCGGIGICEHNRRKDQCKDCNGSQICEHKSRKNICKKCKGKSICEHNRVKIFCKVCDGSQICQHKKIRSRCKECKGGSICEHNRHKEDCKDCGGSQICEHKKERKKCKICNFKGYLRDIISSRIYCALKQNKELSSQEYIGCSTEKLKEHLEKQFKNGMTWENQGQWHIDHIIPVNYKENGQEPTLEEVIKRLHYTNLQPLWASENMSKGNRYIG